MVESFQTNWLKWVVYIGGMLRWFAACLILLSTPVFAGELSGKVIGISDGDTFTLLNADKQQVKIRLAEIDAPESAQPYGNRSKQTLSGLIFSKDVRVAVQTIELLAELEADIARQRQWYEDHKDDPLF